MATLEDGDGNVYRDIPCVATLAGEGGGGGGSSLPDQTGHSGEFLTTDGTDASWSDKPLVNTATGSSGFTVGGTPETILGGMNVGLYSIVSGRYALACGIGAEARGEGSVAINWFAKTTAKNAIAIGEKSIASAQYAIQLGGHTSYTRENSDANTFKVANANGNFEIMSADGTIPTARLTKVNSTITLTAAGWSSNTQTVSVTGVSATGVVLVSPDPTDQSAYTSAGIICTSQAANSLTFTCSTTPSADIDVNVVCL
jgi:hypothetical protein